MYRVLVGKPEGKKPLGDLGVDGWIILGLIFGERGVYRVLVGKLERRPLWRPRRRWVDNIMMDLWGEGGA